MVKQTKEECQTADSPPAPPCEGGEIIPYAIFFLTSFYNFIFIIHLSLVTSPLPHREG
jgi:hypothetical protein